MSTREEARILSPSLPRTTGFSGLREQMGSARIRIELWLSEFGSLVGRRPEL